VEISDSFSAGQKLKLFAGYAGWSAGQLDFEMSRHDWLTHPATLELVFDPQPDQLWKKIMKQKDAGSRLLADAPDDLSWN
jgi:putative transcriptional regulator